MQWFKHESNANSDDKLQNVLLDYGLEGYGLYWYCLELIVNRVDKENITFELKHDARIIARNTGSTTQKVEEMMKRFIELGLFELSGENITCLKLLKRMDSSMTSNAFMRELLNKAKQHHDAVMTQSGNVMQEEKRREQIRKEIKHLPKKYEDYPEFLEFWSAYPRKDDKKESFDAWLKLNPNIDIVLNALSWQKNTIQWTKDNGQYIPLGATYINKKRWEAEPPQELIGDPF